MATLNVQQPDQTGVTPLSYSPADPAGDAASLVPDLVVEWKNGGASAVTVTLQAVKQCNQGFLHNQAVTIPANGSALISTIDNVRFGTPANTVAWTYSSATNVTVAAYQAH